MSRFESSDDGYEGDSRPLRRLKPPPPRRPRERVRLKTDDEAIPQRNVKETETNKYDPAGTKSHFENTGDAKSILRRLVIDHPAMPVPEIVKIITKAGHAVSPVTVSHLRQEFRQTLKWLNEEGLLRRGVYTKTVRAAQRDQDEDEH